MTALRNRLIFANIPCAARLAVFMVIFLAGTQLCLSGFGVCGSDAGSGSSTGQVSASPAKEKKDLERGDEGFWGYALSTLLIRFVGIFVVLFVLQVAVQVTGRIFTGIEKRSGAKKEAEAK